MQCVSTEMFQTLSAKMSLCLQQKVLQDSGFVMGDVGVDAVDDVMLRLKEKRTMNNKEISYLRQLIVRANNIKAIEYSLVTCSCYTFYYQVSK